MNALPLNYSVCELFRGEGKCDKFKFLQCIFLLYICIEVQENGSGLMFILIFMHIKININVGKETEMLVVTNIL